MLGSNLNFNRNPWLNGENGYFPRCSFCNRTFNANSLRRHEPICYKNSRKASTIPVTQKKVQLEELGYDTDVFIPNMSQLLERKEQRRKEWRKDHLKFITELQTLQKYHNSETSSMSSLNTLDQVLDLSHESQYDEYNLLQMLRNNNGKVSRSTEKIPVPDFLNGIHNKDSLNNDSGYNDINYQKKYKEFEHGNVSGKISKIALQANSNSPILQRTVKYPVISDHILSDNKFYQNMPKCQQNIKDSSIDSLNSESKINLKKYPIELSSNKFSNMTINRGSQLSKSNYELNRKPNLCSFPDKNTTNSETNLYEHRFKKVLEMYSKNFDSPDSKNQQISYETIPKNLSVNRLKLEKLKNFNKTKHNYSRNYKSPAISKPDNAVKDDKKISSTKSPEMTSLDDEGPNNITNSPTGHINRKKNVKFFNELKKKVDIETQSHPIQSDSQEQCGLENKLSLLIKNVSNRTLCQGTDTNTCYKSILKKEPKTVTNQASPNNLLPTVNNVQVSNISESERSKLNDQEKVTLENNVPYVSDNEGLAEKQLNTLSRFSSNPNNLESKACTFCNNLSNNIERPTQNRGFISQKPLNSDPCQIRVTNPLTNSKFFEFATKPTLTSVKNGHVFNPPTSVKSSMLRNEYANAWKIKL